MEGGGNSRHPSRGEQWPFGDLNRLSGPERASLFHGHRDQPRSPMGDQTRGVGVSVSASILPKCSWGHSQFILANLVVGGGTGQLAQDLLIIAAQVFEQRY